MVLSNDSWTHRFFGGLLKAINDFIIVPIYTVAVVTLLIFLMLLIIILCSWSGFLAGYFGIKYFATQTFPQIDASQLYTIFGNRKPIFNIRKYLSRVHPRSVPPAHPARNPNQNFLPIKKLSASKLPGLFEFSQ